ncbi:MAG: relaxase/mobilization nuclease domain-containing protein [Xanthomonadales bacterium]|nr:relaxase/mobilization nuclease domain-containing protein [Xanthomonadales bacterium]
MSNTFDDALGIVFKPIAKPKANKTPGANRAKKTSLTFGGAGGKKMKMAARVAKRTPEVMVKVSGGARGGRGVREHINYITRNGKIEAENERGELIVGREAVREMAAEWRAGDNGATRKNSKDTVNLVLSMPPGTDRDKLQEAVRQFAAHTFGADRQYVFARHDDTKHPHCHLTLKAVGYDGSRLNPRKADLQAWRESFAEALREVGVAAEATPRRARGVVQKPKRQSVLHVEQRGASTVARSKVDQAVAAVAGKDKEARPWQDAVRKQQQGVRAAWLQAAKALEASGLPDAKALATDLRGFVKDMPPIQTEREKLEARMREHLTKERGQVPQRDDHEPTR